VANRTSLFLLKTRKGVDNGQGARVCIYLGRSSIRLDPVYTTIMPADLDPLSCKLLQLGGLIQASIASYVSHKHSGQTEARKALPSKPLFDAQRALLAAAGTLTELVSDPRSRLLEVSSQYFESRALHIVADKRIPDILAQNGEAGLSIEILAAKVGIESRKLCMCPSLLDK
jgi:hypothetical protein